MHTGKPILFNRSFTDLEEMIVQTRAWNMEISKLDAMPFHGKIFQLLSTDFLVSRAIFNGRLKQLGHPPIGFRTFTVPTHPDFWMYWRGREVDGNNLMAFPFGSETDTVSDPRFDVYTISVWEETLFSLSEQLGFQGLEKFLKTEEVLRCDPARMDRLRRCLRQSEAETEKRVPDAASTKNRVLVKLVEALCTAKGDTTANTASHRRLHAIDTINRFIIENPDEIPSIKELCKITQVSKRTLEYAFQEHYGILPKAYINAMRLNGARRTLTVGGSVSDSANAWGFWHMGQFARDYCKLFGELPSQTLEQQLLS